MSHFHETERWLTERARALRACEPPGRLAGKLRPFLDPYHSPLRPAFSFELPAGDERCLLRDGAVPLAWFFGCSPPASRKLFVHAGLGNLVPPAWKKHVRYYELYSEEVFQAARPPKNLLLAGPVNPAILSLGELDVLLDRVTATLGRAKPEKVLVYAPLRKDQRGLAPEDSFELQFAQRMTSRFARVEFLSWTALARARLADTAFVDLNAGWIFADGTLAHHALQAGAGLLAFRDGAPARDETLVPLSRNHGMRVSAAPREGIFRSPRPDSRAQRFYAALHRKLPGQANAAPWPRWFEAAYRAQLT